MNWFGADIYVDFAWGDAPLTADASCTWVDETAYVRSISTRRGTQSELSPVAPGSMSVALDNSGRRFDPSNTAGAHYGELLPMTKVRFRAGAGATVVVFSGFVLGWPITYPGIVDSVVSVQCVDAMRVLEQSDCPGSAYAAAVLADSPDHYWPMQEADGVQLWPLAGDAILIDRPTSVGYFDENTTTTLPLGEPVMLSSGTGDIYPTPSSLPSAVSAWIYDPGAVAAGSPYFVMRTGTDSRLDVYFAATEIRITYSNAAANKRIVATTSNYASIPWPDLTGALAHVAVTATSSLVTVYLNGVEFATVATETGVHATTGGVTTVGISGADPVTPPEASISHAAVWFGSPPSAARILAHYEAGVVAHGHPMGERTGTRIARILDAIGWPSADRDIATGSTVCGQWLPEGRSALAQIRDLEALEQGLFFISADGKPTFRDRKWFRGATNAVTPRYTYGDGGGSEIPYEDIEIDGNHLEHIRNTVTVSYSGGAVTVKDATSRTNYGIQADSVTANDLPASDGWLARQLGNFRLRARKDPTTRIPTLRIQPRGAGALATTVPSVAALELGDRVRVIRRPNGSTDPIQQDCNVLGINHNLTAKGVWTTDLYLAPARKSATEAGYMITGTSLTGDTTTSY